MIYSTILIIQIIKNFSRGSVAEEKILILIFSSLERPLQNNSHHQDSKKKGPFRLSNFL